MPDCIDCPHFSTAQQNCTIAATTQPGDCFLRNCVVGVLLKHLPHWRGSVLEIGFGMRKHARRMLRDNRHATWYGIEPKWPDNPKLNQYNGSAGCIPFGDALFDNVLATETMEHWSEYGESPERGLAEIGRVLKPGGNLVMTVPLHLHGEECFLQGDMPAIEALFTLSGLWENVVFEPWRKRYEPCPPPLDVQLVWPKLRHSDRNCLRRATRPAYTLEIAARRKG